MMRVGITGHQQLETSSAWTWVENMLRIELKSLTHPLVGITSLAIGADQMFARLILEEGGVIHAVLPFKDIERSFSAQDIPAYRDLLARATFEVLHVPGLDEDAYLAAGYRVVDLSDIMITVWNGKPAKGKGGTADIVAYSKSHRIPLIHIDTVAFVVRHLDNSSNL